MSERLDNLEARLREGERITAMQGVTLGILRDNALRHADRETVDQLQRVQTTHGEDIAVLKSKATMSNPINPIDWMRSGWEMVTTTEKAGRAVAALFGLLAVLGVGFVGYQTFRDGGYVDRWLESAEQNADANGDQADALEEMVGIEPDSTR